MPLRDHFRPPVDSRHSWDELHGLWPGMLVLQFDRILPPDYYAAPLIHLAGARVAVGLSKVDEYEVRVFDIRHERRLVAAIEIVSPSNKDRSASRQEFVSNCVEHLRNEVSVAIVDVVTTTDFNLYSELLAFLGQTDPTVADPPTGIYAVACRSTQTEKRPRLEFWHYPFAIGQVLPTLPIWLAENLCVQMDLEVSYQETCRVLRIE